jgi:hypothetical protein
MDSVLDWQSRCADWSVSLQTHSRPARYEATHDEDLRRREERCGYGGQRYQSPLMLPGTVCRRSLTTASKAGMRTEHRSKQSS